MTIILDKEGDKYKVTVKYPKKLKLDDMVVKFDDWEKLSFWLGKECDRHFKDLPVKTPEELFKGLI